MKGPVGIPAISSRGVSVLDPGLTWFPVAEQSSVSDWMMGWMRAAPRNCRLQDPKKLLHHSMLNLGSLVEVTTMVVIVIVVVVAVGSLSSSSSSSVVGGWGSYQGRGRGSDACFRAVVVTVVRVRSLATRRSDAL